MRPGQKRVDYVPAAPVTKALQAWLRENCLDNKSSTASQQGRYFSPFEVLAERMGIGEDAIYRHSKNNRGGKWLQFDVADKLLCAIDRVNLWWDDPELSEVYEEAARGADKIYPLVRAA